MKKRKEVFRRQKDKIESDKKGDFGDSVNGDLYKKSGLRMFVVVREKCAFSKHFFFLKTTNQLLKKIVFRLLFPWN